MFCKINQWPHDTLDKCNTSIEIASNVLFEIHDKFSTNTFYFGKLKLQFNSGEFVYMSHYYAESGCERQRYGKGVDFNEFLFLVLVTIVCFYPADITCILEQNEKILNESLNTGPTHYYEPPNMNSFDSEDVPRQVLMTSNASKLFSFEERFQRLKKIENHHEDEEALENMVCEYSSNEEEM